MQACMSQYIDACGPILLQVVHLLLETGGKYLVHNLEAVDEARASTARDDANRRVPRTRKLWTSLRGATNLVGLGRMQRQAGARKMSLKPGEKRQSRTSIVNLNAV